MPTFWLDKRVRWEAVDDTSARLIFPFNDGEDNLLVHFDPGTGLVSQIDALRHRDGESGKVGWRVAFLTWNVDLER